VLRPMHRALPDDLACIIHDGSSRNRSVPSPPAWTPALSRPGVLSPRLRGWAPFIWSWREERIPHWILTPVSAIAAKTLTN